MDTREDPVVAPHQVSLTWQSQGREQGAVPDAGGAHLHAACVLDGCSNPGGMKVVVVEPSPQRDNPEWKRHHSWGEEGANIALISV